jgi:hypothetical protein
LLDAEAFGDAVTLAVQRLAAKAAERSALLNECERLDRELANLAAAIAAGGELPVLVAEIQTRQSRRAELERVLDTPLLDERRLRASFEAKLRDWKRLLRDRPIHGQRVLRTLLDGPIQVGERMEGGVAWSAVADPSTILDILSVNSRDRGDSQLSF